MYQSLGFVIPAYNEQASLAQIVDKVMSVDIPIDKEIIIVNDCSKDHTAEVMEELARKYPQVKLLHNEQNMGKSRTVKRGLLATTADLVVIQDADLEYDPEDLKAFVALFSADKVDVVYGNRFGRNNKIVYLQNWLGNSFLSLISSLFTGLRAGMWTRDMEVCYKMARGDIFRTIAATLESTSGFGLEPELTAKFSKYKLNGRHLRFQQLPISYYPRTIAQGKHMHAFSDGFKALKEIVQFNLRPFHGHANTSAQA